ncbi:MAG: hypothetical protein K8T20_12535, partial [Planctomycetes bacterium]|nr:hypothetical protein [Planctomycetota bacterium]
MARRRTIEGVLYNFLGTYTSRYSDFDGYWLFGFIVESTSQLTLDLMAAPTATSSAAPMVAAAQLAAAKFALGRRRSAGGKASLLLADFDVAHHLAVLLGRD